MNWFTEGRDYDGRAHDGRDYYGRNWFTGMQLSFPDRWELFDSQLSSATLICRNRPQDRVVIIVSGGGSDGPWAPGFCDEGLADAVVIGAPYTAPNAYAIYEVAKALDQGKGILLLYNNFMGDYLNNDMASELLGLENIPSCQVAFFDDIGTAINEPKENRSGRTGGALLIKLAAKAVRNGASLEETTRLVMRAARRTSTLSITVDTQRNVVTYGKGFSDEPGFLVRENATLRQTAAETIRLLVDDVLPKADEQIFLLVNRLRFTSYADSYVFAGYLHEDLNARFPVARVHVGAYNNILDEYGFTVTLLCADSEIHSLLKHTVSAGSFTL